MQINEKCVWLLGEIMIQNAWLNWPQLETALSVQKDTNRRLGEILVEGRMTTRQNLYRALAIQHGMAFVELKNFVPQPEAMRLMPRRYVYQHQILPLATKDDVLLVAVPSPDTVWPESELKQLAALRDVRCVLTTPEAVTEAIHRYYGPEGLAAA